MYSIGCDGEMLRTAYENMSSGKMNTGITYSNFRDRETVMVIAITSLQKSLKNHGGMSADILLHIFVRLLILRHTEKKYNT